MKQSQPTSKLPQILIFLLTCSLLVPTTSLYLKHQQVPNQQPSSSPTAQIYKGISTITPTPDSNSNSNFEKERPNPNRIQYFVGFSKFQEGCEYKSCYYGWVGNYTVDGEDTVIGYPKNTDTVFSLRVNDKRDFVIQRSPKLADSFAQIIQVSSEMFQPSLQQDLEKAQNKYENFKFIQLAQFQKQNPESSLTKDPPKSQSPLAASILTPLSLPDTSTPNSTLLQQLLIDKQYSILRRTKIIDLTLPSDTFGQEKQKPDFVSRLAVRMERIGEEVEVDVEGLRKIVEELREFGGEEKMGYEVVEKRRMEGYYREDLKFQDKLDQTADNILIKESMLELKSGLSNGVACSLTNSPSAQIPIWSYQKLLFQKTIFGKKFSTTINIQATIVSSNSIRFKGTLTYSLFGSTKTVQIFNIIKQINLNWSKNYNINGSYGASVYVPLPPPVSFLGVSFGFTVNFGIGVTLYARTGGQLEACVFRFEVGADVGTEVGVGATAAVRAVVIQGGVFIDGTLVNLSTDPKLAIAYNVQTRAVTPTITWYLYIKAFKFEWGFFYRTWSLWSGWSGKKIIAKWPISNGITQTILIYKT